MLVSDNRRAVRINIGFLITLLSCSEQNALLSGIIGVIVSHTDKRQNGAKFTIMGVSIHTLYDYAAVV